MRPNNTGADLLKHSYGYGLLGRINYFVHESELWVVLLVIALMATCLILALTGKRLQLFLLMLITLVFYGSVWRSLDSATGLARMLIILLISLQLMRSRSMPGVPLMVFAAYVLAGLPFVVNSTDLTWSIQWGGLTLLSAVGATVMGDYMHSRKDVARVLTMFIIAAGAWALLGASSLRELARAGSGGERFYGAFESVGAFTDSGGFCLAFVLWGVLRPWHWSLRLGCGLLFVTVTLILLAAGQRTPLYGGAIACLPLLVRFNFRQAVLGTLLLVVVGVVSLLAARVNQQQTAYVLSRYTSTSTTNRWMLWGQGFTAILENPVIGHGFGSNRREMREHLHEFNTVHNMYLSVWYDTGLIGVALFGLSIALQAWAALRMVRHSRGDPEVSLTARLFLGNTLAIAAAGFFEAGASSPSALATTILLISMVGTQRLTEICRDEAATRRLQYRRWQQWWTSRRLATRPQLVPVPAVGPSRRR